MWWWLSLKACELVPCLVTLGWSRDGGKYGPCEESWKPRGSQEVDENTFSCSNT